MVVYADWYQLAEQFQGVNLIGVGNGNGDMLDAAVLSTYCV